MELPKGSIVVFDRGYISYPWVPDFRGNGRLFRYTAQEERRLQASGTPPCESQNRRHFRPIIEVFSRGKKLCLRRIGYRDPEGGKRYEFLTNHYRFIAKTIADIYKERWKIELFFKEIKQNPRIKSFVGNSENAALIQVYTALTVYLLLAYQKFLSRLELSLQQLFQLIQINLPGTTSLEELLNPRRRKNEIPYNLSLLNLAA